MKAKCKFIRAQVDSWTPEELADEIERLAERANHLEAILRRTRTNINNYGEITSVVMDEIDAALGKGNAS